MVKNIKGSPTNWRLDASEDSQLVEVEDRGNPKLNPELTEKVGQRVGERKAMYLSREDFERHGFTDGCIGCRDIASGKKKPEPAAEEKAEEEEKTEE